MSADINLIAGGAKFVLGVVGGWAMNNFAEATAEMVFDRSSNDIFQNDLAKQITIKAVGVTSGIITSACISKKIDDAKENYELLSKAFKEAMEKVKAEQQKKQP